jgi:hypothetical protein
VLNACKPLPLVRMQLSPWTWPLPLTFHLVVSSVYHTERNCRSGCNFQVAGHVFLFAQPEYSHRAVLQRRHDYLTIEETCKWNAEVTCHLQSQHLRVILWRRHGRCWKQGRKTSQTKFPNYLPEKPQPSKAPKSDIVRDVYNTHLSLSRHTHLSC